MTKKEALLKAAKELFGEHGYAETTFAMISQRAGVAMGLLAHHYGNKEKLFLAAGMDVLESLLARLRSAIEDSPSGAESVRRFCRAYLDACLDPDDHFLVLIRCSPYSDMKTREDRETMTTKFSEVWTMLEACVSEGMRDGTLEPGDARLATQFVSCSLVGAVRTLSLTPYPAQGLPEEVIDRIALALAPCGCKQ
ncbi:transcriptional regulator, TetR family [Alkalidesulfovibrio alkalitolerans DSM 16529]|jgi:AcrR family transcriptional regulator|uniref:Transcriptional regulator, TetR family n=1 Tax=Alkalidesulfovibrio alkalitolerans DSM 16529 TaxID=1121439 RepID=S7T7F9_9BACT|nr:TetR/AcrR family transcriptional regulator [Alkalidesulfovibrio alkalitolerans]EPR32430.1 transcriptional regulator, TetR family [Alkalidesulfovibrio alkalitolerans DSM 16529]